MHRIFFLLLVCLLTAISVVNAAEERSISIRKKGASVERRLALVIGNGSYPDAPLKNPINDVDAMAKSLRETGFDVITRKNADRKNMFSAIKEFGQKLKKYDVGLFYYAGHGVQIDSANFFLPVDLRSSDLQDGDDLRRDAVPLNELMDRMRDSGTNNIVILDACRDNPFMAKLSRSATRGLAKVVTPASTSILYSTDPGNTASDGSSGENGVFTIRLVESIQKEGLELVDVMREVSVAVNRDTNGAQRPVFDGVLSSKFYFKAVEPSPSPIALPAASPIVPPTPSVSADSQAIELRYWESAERTNTISAYKAYLKKFPAGDFVDVAVEKIQILEQAKSRTDVAAKAELARKEQETAEQSRLAKERIDQERRLKEIEAKALQAEERARLIEERVNKSNRNFELQAKAVEANTVSPMLNFYKKDFEYESNGLEYYKDVVVDTKTNLMWPRNGDIAEKKMEKDDARVWAEKLNYVGFSDWRLPTIEELEMLSKKGGRRPSAWFNSKGFRNVKDSSYASSFELNNMYTKTLDMYNGGSEKWIPKTKVNYVWPVREVR